MKFRDTYFANTSTGLGALLVAALVLPGGSVLLAWVVYRWVTGARKPPDTAQSR